MRDVTVLGAAVFASVMGVRSVKNELIHDNARSHGTGPRSGAADEVKAAGSEKRPSQ